MQGDTLDTLITRYQNGNISKRELTEAVQKISGGRPADVLIAQALGQSYSSLPDRMPASSRFQPKFTADTQRTMQQGYADMAQEIGLPPQPAPGGTPYGPPAPGAGGLTGRSTYTGVTGDPTNLPDEAFQRLFTPEKAGAQWMEQQYGNVNDMFQGVLGQLEEETYLDWLLTRPDPNRPGGVSPDFTPGMYGGEGEDYMSFLGREGIGGGPGSRQAGPSDIDFLLGLLAAEPSTLTPYATQLREQYNAPGQAQQLVRLLARESSPGWMQSAYDKAIQKRLNSYGALNPMATGADFLNEARRLGLPV